MAAVRVLILLEGSILLGGGPGTPTVPEEFTSPVRGLGASGFESEHAEGLLGVEVLLVPWAAFTLFGSAPQQPGCSAAELSELSSTLDVGLRDGLYGAADWPARFAVLDAVLGRSLLLGSGPAPRVVDAWSRLSRSAGTVPIPELARAVGWCQSQLQRRFLEQIGVTPKTAARILRLERAMRLLSEGRPAAAVAIAGGYYDQAHLSREMKAMTGHPPRSFQSRVTEYDFLQDRRLPGPAEYSSEGLAG
ncbi:helix-turn-helix domain-containing protein [Streptomyces sp. NPDC058401]|uniref:helix-turn-helix domain-containing protein n=1 Tax=Streptomyces sp. NPDC058401 TaxID=3346480 RepID=UPI0036676A0A